MSKPGPIRMRGVAEIHPPDPPSTRAAARHSALEAAHARIQAAEEEIEELEKDAEEEIVPGDPDDEADDVPSFAAWLKERGIEELPMDDALDTQLALFLAEVYPDLFTTKPADEPDDDQPDDA